MGRSPASLQGPAAPRLLRDLWDISGVGGSSWLSELLPQGSLYPTFGLHLPQQWPGLLQSVLAESLNQSADCKMRPSPGGSRQAGTGLGVSGCRLARWLQTNRAQQSHSVTVMVQGASQQPPVPPPGSHPVLLQLSVPSCWGRMALLGDLGTRVLGLPSTCPACPCETLLRSTGQVEGYGHSSWSHIS